MFIKIDEDTNINLDNVFSTKLIFDKYNSLWHYIFTANAVSNRQENFSEAIDRLGDRIIEMALFKEDIEISEYHENTSVEDCNRNVTGGALSKRSRGFKTKEEAEGALYKLLSSFILGEL